MIIPVQQSAFTSISSLCSVPRRHAVIRQTCCPSRTCCSVSSRANRRGYLGMHVSLATSVSFPSYCLNICSCFARDVAGDIPASALKSAFMDLLSTNLSGPSLNLCVSTTSSQVHYSLQSTDLLPGLSSAPCSSIAGLDE